jgi:hypothetical protein
MIIRQGYEHYENDLIESLSFLKNYDHEVIEQRTDGSFYAYTVTIQGNKLGLIRYYYEFIEQFLKVTLQINGENTTTLDLNQELNLGYKKSDLFPIGDEYQKVLQNTASIIQRILKNEL